MAEIGDILERTKAHGDGRDRIRLTAVNGTGFIAETLDEFGPPVIVSQSDLAADYGVTDVALPDDEATALRKQDQATIQRAARSYFGRRRNRDEPADEFEPHPDSPEGQFRAAKADDGDE